MTRIIKSVLISIDKNEREKEKTVVLFGLRKGKRHSKSTFPFPPPSLLSVPLLMFTSNRKFWFSPLFSSMPFSQSLKSLRASRGVVDATCGQSCLLADRVTTKEKWSESDDTYWFSQPIRLRKHILSLGRRCRQQRAAIRGDVFFPTSYCDADGHSGPARISAGSVVLASGKPRKDKNNLRSKKTKYMQ